MLCCDKINVSGGTDINKTSPPKAYLTIGIFWMQGLDFVNLYDIALLNIRSVDYCCIINETDMLFNQGKRSIRKIKDLLTYIKWVRKF